MIRRLLKELNILYPYTLVSAAIITGLWYFTCGMDLNYQGRTLIQSYCIPLLIAQIAGILPFGIEFREGVCNRLLSMPCSRLRIFWEKNLVLLIILVTIGGIAATRTYWIYLMAIQAQNVHAWELYVNFMLLLMGLVFTFFIGPCISIILKRPYTAFWASVIAILTFYIVLFGVYEQIEGYPQNKIWYDAWMNSPYIEPIYAKIGIGLPLAIYTIPWCVVAFVLAWWMWKRLEV